MKSFRYELRITPSLNQRIEDQIALTGEGKGEFIRRCLLDKLEAMESRQAELRLVSEAMERRHA